MKQLLLITIFLIVACTKEEQTVTPAEPAAQEISAPADTVSGATLEESEAQKNARLHSDYMDALKGAVIALDVEVTLKCLNRKLPSNKALIAHMKAANPHVKMKIISRNSKACSLKAEFEGQGLSRMTSTLPFTEKDRRFVGL
jgi:hypothetical protein